MELDTIYNMDCLEGMKDIPDGSIDMVLCDLPYGTTDRQQMGYRDSFGRTLDALPADHQANGNRLPVRKQLVRRDADSIRAGFVQV